MIWWKGEYTLRYFVSPWQHVHSCPPASIFDSAGKIISFLQWYRVICSTLHIMLQKIYTFLGQTNYVNIWRFLCQGLTHPRLHLRKSGGMLVLFAPDQFQGDDSPLHQQVICFDEDPKLFSPIHAKFCEKILVFELFTWFSWTVLHQDGEAG